MWRMRCLLIVVVTILGLTGCSTITGKQVGIVVGGVAGATGGALIGDFVIGSTLGVVIGGAVGGALGAFLGGSFAEALAVADQAPEAAALQQGMARTPDGATLRWYNPDSGGSGAIRPQQTRFTPTETCRDFEELYWNNQRQQLERTGTACRAHGSPAFNVRHSS